MLLLMLIEVDGYYLFLKKSVVELYNTLYLYWWLTSPPFIKYNIKKEKIKSKKEKEYNVIILALILLLLFRWFGRTFHKGTAKK